jgi:uncharacterized phage-like protein YoqJ
MVAPENFWEDQKGLVCVTGHRPDKLPDRRTGYNVANPMRIWLRARMREELLRLKPMGAISGMALGVDQDFACVCLELKIPVCAAIPFAGQESMWPAESQRVYFRLLEEVCAAGGKVVEVSPPGYTARKMYMRNEWMVDRASVVIAVWNGSAGGTAHCVLDARKKNRDIVLIDPRLFR